MENLAHNSLRCDDDKSTPSHAGTKHLAALQGQVSGVEADEEKATEKRALLLRAQSYFITKHSVGTLTSHAEKVGFSYKPTTLAFSLPAQLLLNKNVGAAKGKTQDTMRNEVSQTARALAELARLDAQHSHMTDAEFIAWYRDKGQITGLAKAYLGNQKSAKGKSANDATTELTAEHVVNAMLENSAVAENTGNKRGHGSAGPTGIKRGQSC